MQNWFRGPLLALSLLLAMPAVAQTPRFEIKGEHFLLDGKPIVLRVGEMHYPRVPHEYWRQRLRMARAMGLNAIQTYVFWNLHEPEPGRFDFSGNLDIAAFARMAQEEGLHLIVRPGPYICTELDFGGYPAWLLRTPGLRVRSLDPRYMQAAGRYLERVGDELAPLQATRGGPIIMVQVENEYGSFGNDHDYMAAVNQQVLDAGFDVPLFTSDGPGLRLLEGGTLPGVTSVINFAGGVKDAQDSFAQFARFRSGVPRMVGEYWAGWFDHWGEQHHTTDAKQEAETVGWFLDQGISFSLYMFHGGTSWGYLAGANYNSAVPYQPDTTSYDYDAPLDESGRPTPKFFALRAAIASRLPTGETLPEVPQVAPTIAIPRFELKQSVSLLDALPRLAKPVESRFTRGMEDLGQNFGFVLYRKQLERAGSRLKTPEVRDYAVVLADGTPVGTLDRRLGERQLDVGLKAGATLDLLVENMGRIGFNQKLVDERKGLLGPVSLGDDELTGWQNYSLPLDDLSALKFKSGAKARGPAFWRGTFKLKAAGDTFIDTRGWGKGHVWINGHHLGRYWHIGPQQTLFVPGVWLREGRNEVVVLDVESGGVRSLQGLAKPVYATVAQAPKK